MSNFDQKKISDFILQVLHPDIIINDNSFPKSDAFWNNLIYFASSHLILPAFLSSIKSKKLNNYVPKDLISYLIEISDLNQKRNIEITSQIKFISDTFKKYKIEHAFIKGAALLICKPYNVVKDRMIGDIDIIVSKNDILKAQKILFNLNFKEQKSNDIEFLKNISQKKHLPRLINSKFISAVELHLNLFENDYIDLIDIDVIMNQKVLTTDGFYILSKKNLWIHTILNWQLNDYGYKKNFLSFRSVIDVIYLDRDNYFMKNFLSNKYLKHFYSLMSVHLNDYPVYYPINKAIYTMNLRFKLIFKLNHYFYKSADLCKIIFSRTFLFLKSKYYRAVIINNRKILLKKLLYFWKN